ALIVVLAGATIRIGGLGVVAENLSKIPRFTDLFGIAVPVDETGAAVTGAAGNLQGVRDGQALFGAGASYGVLSILSCLAWGLGYFGMPQVLLRFMAITRSSKLRQSRAIAVTWCVISLFAAVAIGMVGRALMPGLLRTAGQAETIFIELTITFFPPIIAGLVLSGILAASMSSADSYMLIASSAIARNLFGGLLTKKASARTIMWIARIALLVISGFGIFIALSGNDSIFRVVSYAWAGFGAAFGPLILFSLFWKRTTLAGAIAGMVSGGLAVVIWKELISKIGGAFAVYELLPAFIISCVVIWVVSLLTPKPSDAIIKEFESVSSADI
ncbi:MAG: sodium:proline symporter, partial [Clostridiaceae bacterium]|nr:sodium:proline symporter [Clostridiaceae bacterium]